MTTVELIYDLDCPNVSDARSQLLRAFAEAALPPHWQEWDRGDPASPPHALAYGSPTILVGGKDIAGVAPSDGAPCCRLYRDPSGHHLGAPTVESIASALRAAGGRETSGGRRERAGWRSSLATLPAIGAVLLPAGTCPLCWPIYAGLLSAVGLGFLLKTAYLLPVVAVLLLAAVGALAFRARARRGYGPFFAGLIALGVVVLGKFVVVSDAVTYGGLGLLVAASLWNAWPRKTAGAGRGGACPACAPEGRAPHLEEPGAKEMSS